MGLDTSHGAWSGAYSAFYRWRCEIAKSAGFPNWDCPESDPLGILLNHSDCDGEIAWEDCKPIADRLTELLPKLEGDEGGHIGDIKVKTQTFIDGLMLAFSEKENLEFH